MLKENLKNVQNNIKKACERVGRKPEEVTLVAVSKMKPLSDIEELLETGQLEYGENYVQELCDKYDAYAPVDLQFIGHLQTNKIKYLIDKVSMIQSVENERLAAEISRLAVRAEKSMDVLVEVNIGREENKSGVLPEKLEDLLERIAVLPGVHVRGLMAIPPARASEAETMQFFSKMNQYFVDIGAKRMDNIDMHILSMGMSADYAMAISAGANMVRVGSSLFGPRHYQ